MSRDSNTTTALALADALRHMRAKRREVVDWMNAEGAAGRLRQNDQAPCWKDYEAAMDAYDAAAAAALSEVAEPGEGDG